MSTIHKKERKLRMKNIYYYKYSKLAAISRPIETYETTQISKLMSGNELLKIDTPSSNRSAYKEILEMIRDREIDCIIVHSLDVESINNFKALQESRAFEFQLKIVNFFTDKEVSNLTCKELLRRSKLLIDAMLFSKIEAQLYFKLSRTALIKVLDNDLTTLSTVTVVKLCEGLNINPFRIADGPIEHLRVKYDAKEVY